MEIGCTEGCDLLELGFAMILVRHRFAIQALQSQSPEYLTTNGAAQKCLDVPLYWLYLCEGGRWVFVYTPGLWGCCSVVVSGSDRAEQVSDLAGDFGWEWAFPVNTGDCLQYSSSPVFCNPYLLRVLPI